VRPLIAGLAAAMIGAATIGATAGRATGATDASPPTAHAAAAANNCPLLRTISWSGFTWLVFPCHQTGPEKTQLDNSEKAVHVDSQGRLHIAITKTDGVWRGAELELLNPTGYGTYNWVLDTKISKFAPTTVLGFFNYRPNTAHFTNEIDIEDSKFKHLGPPNNAQFAVQPYTAPHHYIPYRIRPKYSHLFQQFQWLPGSGGNGIVHFVTRAGTTSHGPVIKKWSYKGSSTPTTFNMHLFIDIWLNTNRPPVGGTHSAIIKSVHFTPLG
jgi:hypothetical protein